MWWKVPVEYMSGFIKIESLLKNSHSQWPSIRICCMSESWKKRENTCVSSRQMGRFSVSRMNFHMETNEWKKNGNVFMWCCNYVESFTKSNHNARVIDIASDIQDDTLLYSHRNKCSWCVCTEKKKPIFTERTKRQPKKAICKT